MENWESKHQDLGEVKIGTKVKLVFKTTPEAKEIVFIRHDCSCTSGSFDKDTGIYLLKYTAKIPKHLKNLQRHTVTKGVTISYKDGTNDYLSFTLTVVK